jgi:uncharacterized lipoprotein YmbA
MNKKSIYASLLMAIILNIAGCGSSPKAKFYIMNPLERDLSSNSKQIVIKLGPVTIPEILLRPQIVTRSNANMLLLNEFNRWGGDFQEDFQRIVGENLSILLATDHVTLSQDITPLQPDYQVTINVRQFDGMLGGSVTLNADWTIASPKQRKTLIAKKSVLQENTNGIDYQDYVATQSRLLVKLSQEISTAILQQMK